MNRFAEQVNFIWSIADLLRDSFKRSKYQDVILPLTVLRRIDGVLAPTKPAVLSRYARLKGKLENLDPQLRRASGFAFYNTSPYDFDRLLDDPPHLGANLRAHLNSFSDNMREVLEKFDFANTIARLEEAGLLFLVLERFKNVDLHPDGVGNLEMGYVFEELIRKFNEALNENPGEHFTPREVIRLMVNLLLVQDGDALSQNRIVRTVYDPCCGSGGMLTIAKERIVEINPYADVYLFGQEVNPETFAVCKSDLYMKSPDGRDAENIKFGSTLSRDQHRGRRFDYLLANSPYGKEWKNDEKDVREEAARANVGRFGAGLPRISDGQLLFLHKLRNVRRDVVGTATMNRAQRQERRTQVLADATAVYAEADDAAIRQRLAAFRATWSAQEPAAVATLERDFEQTIVYLRVQERARQRGQAYPVECLRTTSALERVNRHFRQKARHFLQSCVHYPD
ncbi:MAG: N-6 DNA methylase [Chloroflexi bacterium]|nr:N-6 DNA methylase [Chloroflexota bacterium]